MIFRICLLCFSYRLTINTGLVTQELRWGVLIDWNLVTQSSEGCVEWELLWQKCHDRQSVHDDDLSLNPQLLYSGKLSREKTFANWWKTRFSQRKLCELLAFAMPRMPHPQILWSWIATKPLNLWKFSPSKVSCYMVCPIYYCCVYKRPSSIL